MQDIRRYLPKAFETDTLLANCVWESVNLFNENFEVNLAYLEMALVYVSEMGNAILRQGVLSMIWHYYISKRLSILADLIDKVIL